MERTELTCWLRLLLTEGIGRTSGRKLLATFGLPEAVFEQSAAALEHIVTPAQADALLQEPPELAEQVQTTWQWLQAEPDTRRVLTLGDALYPQRLLETEDPPLLLFASGMAAAWQHNLLNSNATACMAIVGSRNPTPQGAENARQFAAAMAQAGLCVVSGMAMGVDGAAHEGALQGALQGALPSALSGAAPGALATIAVVGTGLDRVYPRQHRDLAHRITAHGVMLSELPLGSGPLPAHFPQRNRIISGLSRGVLVVEAALQSGSLITARLAAEQGREVFAIPGSIHATQARGCHALIKQGAKLVESAQDVLEELQWNAATALTSTPTPADTPPPGTAAFPDSPDSSNTNEPSLLQALGHDPASLDTLQARTGLPTQDLLSQLMTLELQNTVARLPGGLYQRITLG